MLQELSVLVKPGQALALVGPSGWQEHRGVWFYNPQNGSLALDGSNLHDLNLQWLRSQIGIVSKEPVLFDATIAENVCYGALFREVSDAEVIEAANIHNFIESLPLHGKKVNMAISIYCCTCAFVFSAVLDY